MRMALLGGSLRPDSLNTRLLGHLATELEARGHEVSAFTGAAQGLLIVSPEYNAGIPGHLKNAVDWLSTMGPSPWQGLPVLLCAASPGAFGGARGLVAWRAPPADMGAPAYAGAGRPTPAPPRRC